MNLKVAKKVESSVKNEDKTIKYLFETEDRKYFEGVLIFEDTVTLCTSSQIGCPVSCQFCRTGRGKFERNLRADEIANQVKLIEKYEGEEIETVSYMGMGEPLLNIENVIKSMQKLDKNYKISTTLVPEQIKKLAKIDIPIDLYVSLHAATEEKRKKLIPRYNSSIEEIIEEINEFVSSKSPINIWYLLLNEFNDSVNDAKELLKIVNKIKNVNCIYLKEYCETGTGFERSPKEKVENFMRIIKRSDFSVSYSVSEGQNIKAGCGQLKKNHKKIQRNKTRVYNT